MGVVTPCVDSCEEDDGGRGVAHERELAPKLGHPQLRVEDVAEQLLLIGRCEVLDLAANARRYLRRHVECS